GTQSASGLICKNRCQTREDPINFYTRIWSEKVTDYDIYDEVLLEMATAYEDGKNWKGIRDGA
ncbi:hypothetical protein, partial [Turicimonas muris]